MSQWEDSQCWKPARAPHVGVGAALAGLVIQSELKVLRNEVVSTCLEGQREYEAAFVM